MPFEFYLWSIVTKLIPFQSFCDNHFADDYFVKFHFTLSYLLYHYELEYPALNRLPFSEIHYPNIVRQEVVNVKDFGAMGSKRRDSSLRSE